MEKLQSEKELALRHSPTRTIHQGRQYDELKQYQKSDCDIKTTNTINKSMVTMHPIGKIIDCKYRWIEDIEIDNHIDKTHMLEENKAFLKRFVQDARLGKTIKKGVKKKINKARLIKYVQDLKKLDYFLQKPLDTVTQTDMERFILDLEEGRIKQKNGISYKEETQVCIKKIIIKFYKWLNKGIKPELVDWIDTSYKIKDYRAPSEEQIKQLVNLMQSNSPAEITRNRAIIMVLFDSGARADELLNVRIGNITEENNIFKMRIEYSKTKARTITLPIASNTIKEWLKFHPDINNTQLQLFPISYTALHHMIQRTGNRFKLKITPHVIRHASATYWAKSLSRYQLCSRMGWALSSRQPDRYIDQEGLDQEKVTQIVEQKGVQKLTSENEELSKRMAIMQDQLDRLLKMDREEVLRIIERVKQ